jgi:HK97 family phage major capsid protein
MSEIQNLWHEFKAVNDRALDEAKKLGAASAETNTQLNRINERMDSLETKMNRPALAIESSAVEAAEAKAAYNRFLRTGAVEKKALILADDTLGGYLAPDEYVREIIRGITELSPVRSVARVRQTSSKAIEIPKRSGVFSAAWVAESGARSETTGLTFGLETIPVHEMYALVDISRQMLEDAAFNVEAELAAEFAERFAVAEGSAFVSGDALGKPEGLLTNGSIGETNSGNASAITAAGLIDLIYAIKDGYARNASFMMRRATIGAIRKLTDPATGTYLWQPALSADQPGLLLGKPVAEAVDMPAIAGNAFPVLFGDFRAGYTIVDRVAIEVQRDPFTQAASGNVRFIARKRVGGQVVLPEAIRKLKIAL